MPTTYASEQISFLMPKIVETLSDIGASRILVIDTSSTNAFAIFYTLNKENKCINALTVIASGRAETLAAQISPILSQYGYPDSIVCGVGPGSFTGIRVGIAYAQGLARGCNAKTYPLSSLALLTANSIDKNENVKKYRALRSAGKGEWFTGVYECPKPNKWLTLQKDKLLQEDALKQLLQEASHNLNISDSPIAQDLQISPSNLSIVSSNTPIKPDRILKPVCAVLAAGEQMLIPKYLRLSSPQRLLAETKNK